jgi:4'-phosphopantetheinyl transferase
MARRPAAAPSYAVPERFPPPSARVVRVWLASLDQPPLPLDTLGAALVPDESRRMALFALDRDRARYAAGRGLLRRVLGSALGVAPEDVPLAEGVNGRPVLAGSRSQPVAFNVSHSADRMAIAVARVPDGADDAFPLGVDVEVLRAVASMDRVAARVFDEEERAAIAAHEARDGDLARRAAFHRLWTRKEACMKATGAGLTLAPRTFHVDADAPVQQVRLPAHACAPDGIVLTVHDLPAGEGAAGAVAVAGDGWVVEARLLPPAAD